jgi:hypothetical protein
MAKYWVHLDPTGSASTTLQVTNIAIAPNRLQYIIINTNETELDWKIGYKGEKIASERRQKSKAAI